jgi:hypothetical protein
LQVLARKIRLNRNGTHINQRAIKLVNLVHQHGVFIDFLLLDFDKPLPNGLDVADARVKALQGGEQPDRRRGLALVLTGGGNINAGRDSVHGWSAGSGRTAESLGG